MTAGNPEKGNPTVDIGGREVLAKFTTNGICAVEAEVGQSLEQIGVQLRAGAASTAAIRGLFRSLFIHEVPDMTPVEAGKVLQAIGGGRASEVIQAAFDALKAAKLSPASISEPDQQGRVSFEVGGVRYVLMFGFNALAEMDPIFPGLTMVGIANELLSGGVSLWRMRAMFRAALVDQMEVSLLQAGDLIDRIGIATVADALGKAFLGAFPKTVTVPEGEGDRVEGNRAQRRAAGGGTGNPTKGRRRKAGTGTA